MSSNTDSITVNGNSYDSQTVNRGMEVIRQSRDLDTGFGGARLRTPSDLQALYGKQFGTDRDVYDVLGYDKDVDFDDYHAKYRRQDIARRIVELPAKDTWRVPPTVFDTDGDELNSEFETQANELLEERLNSYLRRVDIAAGIGEYGLLFIGFNDGAAELSEPVNQSAINGPEDIAYFNVFNQGQVQGWHLGQDVGRSETDVRFNKPIEYDIDFSDLDADSSEGDIKTVHWTRVIHVTENAVESDLKGTPRLRSIYNRLVDREKVVGASAEMFWTGAAPRYQFDIRDGFADIPSTELDNLDDKVQRFVHDMQNHIKTMGMDITEFGGQEVDPSGVVDAIDKSVSGSTGIPKRKLLGSERGEQASTQDRANWFDTIKSRQMNHGESQLLRPTLWRFITVGALPSPNQDRIESEWANLFELTEVEESQVQKNRAQTLKNAMPQGNTDLTPGGLEAAIEYIETGTFPDPEMGVVEEPLDEGDEAVREQFDNQFGA